MSGSNALGGKVWKFGDNINTDLMLPGPWLYRSAEEQAKVAREFIQDDVVPEKMADALVELIAPTSPERREVLRGLAEVRAKLGSPGAADRVAKIASDLVGTG